MPPPSTSATELGRRALGRERGQAAVELVAVVPALVIACVLAAQVTLAGYALWAVANAARVAARADAVGRDVRAAAVSALPSPLRDGARVRRDGGRVVVRVRVPLLLPSPDPLVVSARSRLGPSGGAGP